MIKNTKVRRALASLTLGGVVLAGASACVGQPDSRGCTNWKVNGKIVRTC